MSIRVCGSVIVLSLLLGLALAAPVARAVDVPALVAQHPIQLDGTRVIALSPDGTKIAASDVDLKTLCIYDAATLAKGACADLSPLEAGLRVSDVVWSPDSTKLALAEQSFARLVDGDLWLVDAATGALTDLTDDGVNARIPLGDTDPAIHEQFVDVSPAWRPDGSGITFSRSTWREGDWVGNTIETVPVTGGTPKRLLDLGTTPPGLVYYGMRWTTDGSRLFYSSNAPSLDDPTNGIWRVDADGANATQVLGSDPELGDPIVAGVSPDGRTVLAFYARYAATYVTKGPLYALLDVASGVATPLELTAPDAPDYAFIGTAVLSPDGRYVLYATRVTDPDVQIWLRPVAGGGDIPLVPEGLPGATPVDLTAAITWADTGTLLLNITSDQATLLTVSGVAKPAIPVLNNVATPVAAGHPSDAGFAAGDTVTVNDNDVPLRAAPGTDAQTVATLAAGTELTVIAAPVEADGFTWVPVVDPATGTLGYVRGEFLGRQD